MALSEGLESTLGEYHRNRLNDPITVPEGVARMTGVSRALSLLKAKVMARVWSRKK